MMNVSPKHPSPLMTLLDILFRYRSRQVLKPAHQLPTQADYPRANDLVGWLDYWQKMGQPWRREPEIDTQRQEYLMRRLAISPNVKAAIYPFKDIRLHRADVEWLLANHEHGRGPINWSDEPQREREGLDLRGADLRGADLEDLPLAHFQGGFFAAGLWADVTDEQHKAGGAHLEGANLRSAHIEGAILERAHLEGAALHFIQAEEAEFDGAHLERAVLQRANLKNADLVRSHLEGADLRWAMLDEASLSDAHLEEATLCNAFFNRATRLNGIILSSKGRGCSLLADVHWGDANLSVVPWSQVNILGDELKARQSARDGKVKDAPTRLNEYEAAVRANRQLAVVLQVQGLNEDAARFAYHAQKLQRVVLRRQKKAGAYLFSWFLYLLAGYGYRPERSFLAYLFIIGTFTAIYSLLGSHLAWNEAFVISMTAFHGRGFFPGTFSPGDPLAFASAIEAFVGLIIEVTFIATLTQRFFGK